MKRIQIKRLVTAPVTNGLGLSGQNSEFDDPRYIRITDIAENGSLRTDIFSSQPRSLIGDAWVSPGDVLIASVGATVGKTYLHAVKGEYCFAGYLSRVRPNPDLLSSKFFYYWTHSRDYWTQVRQSVVSSTVENLSASRIAAMSIALPSLEEQRRIAEFLDRETAEIDAFIADQQRMVELTTEHFRSRADLFIESVDAPYTKIKYVTDVLSGFPFKSADFEEVPAGGRRLLRGVNIEPSAIRWADSVGIDSKLADEYPEYLLESGDLVLGLDLPLIRGGLRLARIGEDDANCLLVQRVARIRPKDENSVNNSWVEACLLGRRFLQYLEPNFTGVSVPHMSPVQLENFSIPLPHVDQQKSYVSTMSGWSRDHDELVTDLSPSIELSKERRAALISAAVTGQIDVSDRYAAEKVYEEVESRQ